MWFCVSFVEEYILFICMFFVNDIGNTPYFWYQLAKPQLQITVWILLCPDMATLTTHFPANAQASRGSMWFRASVDLRGIMGWEEDSAPLSQHPGWHCDTRGQILRCTLSFLIGYVLVVISRDGLCTNIIIFNKIYMIKPLLLFWRVMWSVFASADDELIFNFKTAVMHSYTYFNVRYPTGLSSLSCTISPDFGIQQYASWLSSSSVLLQAWYLMVCILVHLLARFCVQLLLQGANKNVSENWVWTNMFFAN